MTNNHLCSSILAYSDASVRAGVGYFGWVAYANHRRRENRLIRKRRGVLGPIDDSNDAEMLALRALVRFLHGTGHCETLKIRIDSRFAQQGVYRPGDLRSDVQRGAQAEIARLLPLCGKRWQVAWIGRERNREADRLAGLPSPQADDEAIAADRGQAGEQEGPFE